MRDTTPPVTRVVVVPAGSEAVEFWGDSWAASLQDDGATLKLFSAGSGCLPEAERGQRLAQDLARLLPWKSDRR